ncbi:hypothetical protein BH09PAT2_BH09PAT2_04740 [soil metagenome]
METESNFDTTRRYLSYVDIASIIAGGLLGIPTLAMSGVVGVGMDQSIGKEISQWLENRNTD